MSAHPKASRLELGAHDPLRDESGADLPLVIRIAADGRVFVHDITADMAPVLLALAPGDAALAARLRAARTFGLEEDRPATTISIGQNGSSIAETGT